MEAQDKLGSKSAGRMGRRRTEGDCSFAGQHAFRGSLASNRRHLLPPSPSAGAVRPSRRPGDSASSSPEPHLDVPGDAFRRRSTLPALVDTSTQALMLSRQLQLDFHEVKFAVEEYRGSAKLPNGGMDLDSFRNFLLRVFDIKHITEHLLQDAYENCQAADGPMNTRRFLSWYRDHMFFLQSAMPTGDQKGDHLTLELSKKLQCSCIDLDRVKAQFDNFDLDKSGVIDYNEFEHMIHKLLHCSNKSDVPPHRMQRFWQEVDRDRNGSVDFEEFAVWYLKYFAVAQESGPIEAFYASFLPDVQRTHSLEVLEAKVQEAGHKERTAKEKFLMSESKSCSVLG